MKPDHDRAHRSRFSFTQALVETTLQGELSYAFLLLDHSTHLKEAIGGTDTRLTGGTATTNDNVVICLLDNFEVIGNQSADLISVGEEVLSLPQVSGSLRALVLAGEPSALGNIACIIEETSQSSTANERNCDR